MNTLTLKMPELLNARLDTYAKQKGMTKSEIVRIALSEYFSKDDTQFEGSFFDLSKDLAGSIQAPEDLSENKQYFEGYGA